MAQSRHKLRKGWQSRIQAHMRIAGDQGYADFIHRNRSDIDLAPRAPVQFHAVTPGGNTVMPAESKARPIIVVSVEACPLAEQRVTSIRSHHPARAHSVPAEQHALGM